MSATSRINSSLEHAPPTTSKATQSQPSKTGNGDNIGSGESTHVGEDNVIGPQSDVSLSASIGDKSTSVSSDVNDSTVASSAPSLNTNNMTSVSPSSTSVVSDTQATNIPTTSISTSVATTGSTSNVKGNSGQNITPSGNDNNYAGNTTTVSKPDRHTSSRATNGSESRASTEGHRTPNAENLSKTNLYIRGLATNTTDEALFNLCSQFGNITSTKAILDKLSGDCRGYGFVQFSNPRSAELAVQKLNESGVQAQMARISTLYASHNQHHAHHNQHHNFHHNQFHPNHQNNNNPHHHHHPNGGNHHGGGIGNHRNHNNAHSQSHNSSGIHHNNNDPDPTNLYIANLPTTMSEQELEMLLSQYGPVVSTRILRDMDNRSKGVGFARMESRDKCQEIIDNLNGKPYKGSSESLLVKFADSGVKKRHQHNNHHHNHYSHHHQAHHKLHQEENRWRDTGNTSDNVSSFDQQSNIPHGNQMSDLTMMGPMGYHRQQATFTPAMAPGTAYSAPLGPSAGGPQWIHPTGPGQPWNLIAQHMIPTSGLAPPNQAAAAAALFHSQVTSQMQSLQISHHPGAPMSEGYLPQWPAMWSHPMQPPQPNQSHSMRLAGPIQHLPPAQPQPHDQLSHGTNITNSSASANISSIPQQDLANSKQSGLSSEKKPL